MNIRRYHRAYWTGDSFISFRRNVCYCSRAYCGATKPRTTGFSIYFGRYIFTLSLRKHRNCSAPF